jgi:hypothetical protein
MGVSNIGNLAGSSFTAGTKVPQDVHVVDVNGDPVSFGGSGGTSSTDGAAFNNDTTVGTPVMGAYQSTPDVMTDGDLGVLAIDVNRNLKVNVAAGGTAGTQYTEGDTDASITGTALMMEGAANALVAAPGTAADGLLVNLGTNNDVTVSGVSTAANQTTIIGHVDGSKGCSRPSTRTRAALRRRWRFSTTGTKPTGRK